MSSDTSSAYSGSDTMHSLQSGQEYTNTHLLFHVEVKQHWNLDNIWMGNRPVKRGRFFSIFVTTYISDLIFVW